MEMEILVKIKSNYGTRAVYPVCEISKKLANLIGTKTFTSDAIDKLKALGYIFIVDNEEI
jgi:hypothetical protein